MRIVTPTGERVPFLVKLLVTQSKGEQNQ